MNSNQRKRYLALSRRQLQGELDEMGYGRGRQPAATEANNSTGATGFLVAAAAMTVLFLGLSITGLVS